MAGRSRPLQYGCGARDGLHLGQMLAPIDVVVTVGEVLTQLGRGVRQQGRQQIVSALADLLPDGRPVDVDAFCSKRAVPGIDMCLVAIHQSTVDIEKDRSFVHEPMNRDGGGWLHHRREMSVQGSGKRGCGDRIAAGGVR